MALPNKLKNFLCHKGTGASLIYQGKITEVGLPKLSRKLEDYRGGGMDGTVKIDLGQENLEMTLKVGGFLADLYRDYAAPGIDSVALRFSGAYQRDDTCEVQAVEIFARGRLSEIDPGSAKPGDAGEETFKYDLNYYRLSVDGVPLIEIDVAKMICIVNGVDRMAEIRAAIGMF